MDISDVFGGVGITECQLTVYDLHVGRGLERHRDEILFDLPLLEEVIGDGQSDTRIIRYYGAERQVSGAKATEHAVNTNTETEGCRAHPKIPSWGDIPEELNATPTD